MYLLSFICSLSFFGPSKELHKALIIYKDHNVIKQVCMYVCVYVPYLSVLKPGSYTSRGSNIRRVVKLRRVRLNVVLVETGRRARLDAGSKIIYKK